MRIEGERFNIQMNHQELWNTACDVKLALEHNIANHWIYHQRDWESFESDRLRRCRELFVALGRADMYDGVLFFARSAFQEYNAKVESK